MFDWVAMSTKENAIIILARWYEGGESKREHQGRLAVRSCRKGSAGWKARRLEWDPWETPRALELGILGDARFYSW